MKKYFMFTIILAVVSIAAHSQTTESKKKTGDEWHAAGDAIPRSKAFADDLKKQLSLDDATNKKVFQLYLGNTKSVDEIKLSAAGESEKKDKLQANADGFNEKIKGVLSAEQFKKYTALNKGIN